MSLKPRGAAAVVRVVVWRIILRIADSNGALHPLFAELRDEVPPVLAGEQIVVASAQPAGLDLLEFIDARLELGRRHGAR